MHRTARLGIALALAVLLLGGHEALMRLGRWALYVIFLPITLTFTVQIDLLHLIVAAVSLSCFLLLAFFYWSRERYARLRSVPSRTPIAVEALGAAAAEEDEALPITSILSSIRIFGYLDDPVYTELASAAQEVLLADGDRQSLCQRDFYVVIDGTARLLMQPVDSDGSSADVVLNEIGRGGVASSMLDILAILVGRAASPSPMPQPEFYIFACDGPLRLLKIPSEAFCTIVSKYPKAAGHMIQVILSRFQRVTYATLNEYLGLSDQAAAIEVSLDRDSTQLPSEDARSPALRQCVETIVAGEAFGRIGPDAIPPPVHDELFRMVLGPLGGADLVGTDEGWGRLRASLGVVYARPDTVLVRQGQRSPEFLVVLHGSLLVTKTAVEGGRIQRTISAGHSVGLMSAVMGAASPYTATTRSPCLVLHVSRRSFELLTDACPAILATIGARLLQSIDPIVYAIDHSLEWSHCHAGHVLARQGDSATNIYLILHGRLRCVREEGREASPAMPAVAAPRPPPQICGEYGSGHSVGEIETLLGSKWPGTLQAVRDTDVACIPKLLFDALTRQHPSVSRAITQKLAIRLQEITSRAALEVRPQAGRTASNLRTIAILPVEPAMYRPAAEFCHRLREELACSAPTLLLESSHVVDRLGKHAFSAIGKLKLLEFLNQVETDHRVVLYLADPVPQSRWTRRCIRQADCVLLVADAEADPGVGAFERVLLGVPSCARRELVLLHPSMYCRSGLTRTWLNNRIWITDHHHVSGRVLAMPCVLIIGANQSHFAHRCTYKPFTRTLTGIRMDWPTKQRPHPPRARPSTYGRCCGSSWKSTGSSICPPLASC